MLSNSSHVVFVDEGRGHGTHDDSDGERDEHQTGLSGRISFAFLVNDWEPFSIVSTDTSICREEYIRDEEHVQQAVQHTHVK